MAKVGSICSSILMLFALSSCATSSGVAPLAQPKPFNWAKFPDSVLIQVVRSPNHKIGNTICSGVLIHSRAVLTTAHCATDAKLMTIVFDVEKGHQAKQKFNTSKTKIHPGYQIKKSLFKNDLAILFLAHPAPVEVGKLHTIPKPENNLSLPPGERLIRIGVGERNHVNARNYTDPTLIKAEKGVLETSDRYSYFGDSGGPIYTSRGELIGIHSTVDDFDGKSPPRAYSAYLPFFSDWIQAEINAHLK